MLLSSLAAYPGAPLDSLSAGEVPPYGCRRLPRGNTCFIFGGLGIAILLFSLIAFTGPTSFVLCRLCIAILLVLLTAFLGETLALFSVS